MTDEAVGTWYSSRGMAVDVVRRLLCEVVEVNVNSGVEGV